MNTNLSFKTRFTAGPQMILHGRLLQVPAAGIEQLILRELAGNPALDLKDENIGQEPHAEAVLRAFDRPAGSGEENQEAIANLAYRPPLVERLLADGRLMVDHRDVDILTYMLYSLDEKGYLRNSPAELAAELAVPLTTVERVLEVIKQLDPPGIGAQNLRECLLIQCQHIASEGHECSLVQRILLEVWDDFGARRWAQAARSLGVPQQAIVEAANFIAANLYPYPLRLIADSRITAQTFYAADMVFHRKSEAAQEFRVTIPQADQYTLRISPGFQDALQGDDKVALTDREEQWLREYFERARLFISALDQRWVTLRKIGEYLARRQKDFLAYGVLHLQPLTRSAVAGAVGLHESTISRAVRDKVVLLPDGHFTALSDFFDNSLAPKEAVRQLLAGSNRPLNDRQIAELLEARGLKIARRTVSKYRKQLGIPSSNQRRPGRIGLEQSG